ncbi:hypothetical protein Tco_0276202 [Tanacetum coccineum]
MCGIRVAELESGTSTTILHSLHKTVSNKAGGRIWLCHSPRISSWLEDTDEEIGSGIGAHTDTWQRCRRSHLKNQVLENSEQPESINDTYVLEKDDSNVTPDSSNICTNDNQVDQNAVECVDERDALANLIANLTLDTEENKTNFKELRKTNARV